MHYTPMDPEELQFYQLIGHSWAGDVWVQLICDDCYTMSWHKVSYAPPRAETWAVFCKRCIATRLHSEQRRRPVGFPA